MESDTSIDDIDRAFGLAVPTAASDAPHDQGEQIAEPAQAPAPASSSAYAEGEPPNSVDNLCNSLLVSAENNDLPVPFFANLIWQESRLQLDAVSRVGALGIAQFMPSVALEVGLDNPFDPHQAIPASARFLHGLRDQFGNLGFVAAAYNAGAHRVAEWLEHRRALPRETRTYVVRVTGRSIEAWRNSPVDDSQLTFVRRLPCRELPAFAELEQSQAAQQAAAAPEEPEAQQEKKAAKTAKEPVPARGKSARKLAKRIEKQARASERRTVARKLARRVALSRPAGKPARDLRGARRSREAEHRQRGARQKRRVA